MRWFRLLALLALAFTTLTACVSSKNRLVGKEPLATAELSRFPLLPRPANLTAKKGAFTWTSETRILSATEDAGVAQVAGYLRHMLSRAAGFAAAVETDSAASAGTVKLSLDPAVQHEEGYRLEVTRSAIQLTGKTARGLFYGVQTLRQLLPPQIESPRKVDGIAWTVPAVDISDQPRFPYRGMHLDVGRHFFPVEAIKKYIDWLALYKLNTFHWHLTEDQGWRLEIKKYPRLTEVGGWRKETVVGHNRTKPRRYDGKRYGGFYTQQEAREIVAYAAERFVTVIPEIELPGHARAALAAYPELGCTGEHYEVATHWGVFEEVFCPSETTFEFLQDVLSEVLELFPSTYIHIGGDEVPKAHWQSSELAQQVMKREGLNDVHELQSYFIGRIGKFLQSKGRKLIGWDEILEGGLVPGATVMSWRGVQGGVEAAKRGHHAVMTPTDHCYFDYCQGSEGAEPLCIGGHLPVQKVYAHEPIPEELNPEQARFILGAQGNVWTEYIKEQKHLEYMVFPRLIALSEVVWSPRQTRDWDSFRARLIAHLSHLDQLRVNYARHVLE